jgi:hypothetical protein
MVFDPSRWRVKLRKWRAKIRKHLMAASAPNAKRWIVAKNDELRKTAFSTILHAPVGLIAWFFWDFLEPGSAPFFLAIFWMIAISAFIRSRHYRAATALFALLLCVIPVLFVSASYYIASDQSRLRYRTTGGISYVEFPGLISLLKSITSSYAPDKVISVISCGNVKVAKLPLLPYKPLYAEADIVDSPFGFRRLPNLRLETIELTVKTSTGTVILPSGEHKTSASVGFGFDAFDSVEIPITRVLPRSMTCLDANVPLLPIFEVLPWDPNQTQALIKTTAGINRFRKLYTDGTLSLDSLPQLHIDEVDGQYKSLLDYLAYSIAYHVFIGNIFAETRADIGNKLCAIVANRPDAFSGPFSSIPEDFLRQIVAEIGAKYQLAYPACDVSDDLLSSVQRQASDDDQIPFFATFDKCLKAASSVTECIAQDDVPRAERVCDAAACAGIPHTHISQEAILQIYDSRFSEVVAASDDRLVKTMATRPNDCLQLRDDFERSQFVSWWTTRANRIFGEPFLCSSPEWRRQYTESREMLQNALACGRNWGIRNIMSEKDADASFDAFLGLRCNQHVDAGALAPSEAAYKFFDQLDAVVDKLKRYSGIIGRRRIDAVTAAFEMFKKIRDAACGTLDTQACVDKYANSHDFRELTNKIYEIVDISMFNNSDSEIVDKLSRLDNIIVDMGICDLLQDENIRQRTGYTREAYCDDHGLEAYRLAGSTPLGHSIERPTDRPDIEGSYQYESNGMDKEFIIKLPADHK